MNSIARYRAMNKMLDAVHFAWIQSHEPSYHENNSWDCSENEETPKSIQLRHVINMLGVVFQKFFESMTAEEKLAVKYD